MKEEEKEKEKEKKRRNKRRMVGECKLAHTNNKTNCSKRR
jgi:hypothetical protein